MDAEILARAIHEAERVGTPYAVTWEELAPTFRAKRLRYAELLVNLASSMTPSYSTHGAAQLGNATAKHFQTK